eukprot:CAMPEP_0117574718 /NCGR_PEP_ID=MMETSP0784-20121206/61765_2 /TAXON_ID=39447 /ORGANISM="" /LENGTH=115 /DNA_ID=CAMNT_0005373625 /DNA_START=241 /DNA_END=585 /DNA_ORIENTATION=-
METLGDEPIFGLPRGQRNSPRRGTLSKRGSPRRSAAPRGSTPRSSQGWPRGAMFAANCAANMPSTLSTNYWNALPTLRGSAEPCTASAPVLGTPAAAAPKTRAEPSWARGRTREA